MAISFKRVLDLAYESKSVTEVLSASPSALEGVSAAGATKLKEALGVTSIAELAKHKAVRGAQALLAAAGLPSHDPGPGPDWSVFFDGAPISHYVNHPAKRFRTEFGPVYYRGRLDGTGRVLLVGQDPSTDEILAHRIFVGRSGQRVQGLFAKLGIARSYVLANTFLFPVYGQFDAQLQAISMEPQILGFRNAFLDRLATENVLEAVIAIGAGAQHAVAQWPKSAQYSVFNLVHPSATEGVVIASWNQNLPGLRAKVRPDDGVAADGTPYGAVFTEADHDDIPRFDLPFGVPAWHGAQGKTTSDRDGATKITWTAP